MKVVFLAFLAASHALWPVKDFRVSSLGGHKKLVVKEEAILPAASTITISTTNSLDSSAPTVTLANDVQMVLCDESRSISYINMSLADEDTGYRDTFAMLLDTGSPLTWIYNQSCTNNGCSGARVRKFNDFARPLTVQEQFQLSYSGQTVSGDVLNAGDNGIALNINNLHLSNVSFGLASDSPEMFDGFDVSGIIGIPCSQNDQKNIIRQLYETGAIDKQMFSFSLVSSSQTVKYIGADNRTLSLPRNYGGLIIFGSKATQYQDKFVQDGTSIHYADILDNNNGYWLIEVSNIDVLANGSSSAFNSTDNTRNIIIDTGTTGLVLSPQDAQDMHRLLFGDNVVADGKGNFAFPCSNTQSSFSITVDNHNFTIDVNDFKGKEYTTQGLQGYCASMIQGIASADSWVFGAAFLSKFYTVFDLEQKRIGFGDSRISAYSLEEPSNQAAAPNFASFANSTSSHTQTSLATSTKPVSTSASSKHDSGAFRVRVGFLWVLLSCIL